MTKFDWIYRLMADKAITEVSHRHVGVSIALRNVRFDDAAMGFQVRQTTVADSAGVSVDTVKRAYKTLLEHGYIQLVAVRKRGRGYQSADKYRLTFPVIGSNLPPINEEIGSTHAENRLHPAGKIGGPPHAVTSENYDLRVFEGFIEGCAPDGAPTPVPNEPPKPHCAKHPGGTSVPCRGCKEAREEHQRWIEKQRDRNRIAKEAKDAAIAACGRCDDHGHIETLDGAGNEAIVICNHQEVA